MKPEILAVVDSRFASFSAYVQKQQAAYLAKTGRYFQGLLTHKEIPADGEEVAPDNLDARPAKQTEGWLDVGQLPEKTVSALRIDRYSGGFVVRVYIRVEEQLWTRAIDFGSGKFTSDWTAVHEFANEARLGKF